MSSTGMHQSTQDLVCLYKVAPSNQPALEAFLFHREKCCPRRGKSIMVSNCSELRWGKSWRGGMEAAKATEFPFLSQEMEGRKRGEEQTSFLSSSGAEMLSRQENGSCLTTKALVSPSNKRKGLGVRSAPRTVENPPPAWGHLRGTPGL